MKTNGWRSDVHTGSVNLGNLSIGERMAGVRNCLGFSSPMHKLKLIMMKQDFYGSTTIEEEGDIFSRRRDHEDDEEAREPRCQIKEWRVELG